MDRSIIKKDIAVLVKTINEQFAAIEKAENFSQQQTALLVHHVEQLHKKVIMLEYANAETPVVETKTEETQKVKPVETIVNSTPPVTEKIVKEEVVIPEIKTPAAKGIKMVIGINDKFEFINELFKGSAADYEASLQLLNNSENRELAVKAFNELQKKYNWQQDNETADRLLEMVERRFL